VIRVAERDPHEAAELLEEKIARLSPAPVAMHDWPDLLASDIRNYQVGIADWADAKGLARETVSRGFARVWGTSPSAFRQELRARAAWIDIVTTDDDLAGIAVEHGFFDQPHMTRAIRALTGAPPAAWRRRVRAREVRLQL
jgi:AraC-like DNA-binding protein